MGESKLEWLAGVEPQNGSPNSDREADIVFVHGLGGHFHSTWHPQESKTDRDFFPSWLAQDFDRFSIWSIGYDADPVSFNQNDLPLVELGDDIKSLLANSGELGDKPIFFITHSLGGIVVKQMLRNAQAYGDEYEKAIANNTKGIVYIATPHSGAGLASLLVFFGIITEKITSARIKDLERSNPQLLELNRVHRGDENFKAIPVKIFGENQKTKWKNTVGVMVVDKASVDLGLPNVSPLILKDEDHISIAKPKSPEARLYKEVKVFIKRNFKKKQPLVPLETKQPESQANQVINVENGDYFENVKGNVIKVQGNYRDL